MYLHHLWPHFSLYLADAARESLVASLNELPKHYPSFVVLFLSEVALILV